MVAFKVVCIIKEDIMERPKGGMLLRVVGIIMIVGGGLGIILSIFSIRSAVFLMSLGGSAVILIGTIIAALAAIAELIAGIVCTKNSFNPAAASKCILWSIITIVLIIIGNILTITGTQSFIRALGLAMNNTFTNILSLIIGIVLPVLAIIGAIILKKNAGGDVSLSGLAKDTASQIKELDNDVASIAKDAKDKVGDIKDKIDGDN